MQRESSDHRCHQDAHDRQQQNRRQVLAQLPDVDVDPGFEKERGQEKDQDDVRR